MPVSQEPPLHEVDEVAAAGIGYVEGEYMPVNEARVSIRENGFAAGDCTYDVVAVWDGAFFRLDDHIERLFRGCERLKMSPLPASPEGVREMMFEMVRRSGLRRAYVQALVTRGVPAAGKQRDPRLLTPQLYGYTLPYLWILAEDKLEEGIDLIVAPPDWCTDNAAMGAVAIERWKHGRHDDLDLDVLAGLQRPDAGDRA